MDETETRLLLYAVAFGAGVGLVSIVRRGALPTLRFHAGALAGLATGALAALLAPDLAELIATPLVIAFGLLAVLPSVLVVAGRRCARARRFSVASAGLWTGGALLGLPVPLRREAELYDALAASERGDEAGALRRLRALADAGGIPEAQGGRTLVEALPRAGARRWAEALAIVDGAPSRATAVLAIESRAAAETGDVRRAVRACSLLDGRSDAAAARASCRRAILAAAGRTEVLEEAARESWPLLHGPRGTADLTLGRAYEASGDAAAARRCYERALRRGPLAMRRDAAAGLARLASAPQSAARLDEIEIHELQILEQRCRDEARVAGRARPLRPWTTWGATAVTAAVSGAVTLRAGSDGFALLAAGALSAPLVDGEGQWWRLFTAMLLHGGWWHLLLNLGCIVPVGILVERRLGSARTLLVYLGGGLVGSLASVYLNRTDVGVGASGAAMGLIGALLVLLLRRPEAFAQGDRRRWLSLLAVGVVATALIGLLEHRHVDNAAHGAGLVGGALIALLVVRPRTGRETALRRAGARLAAVLLLALTAAAAVEARAEFLEWRAMRSVRARGAVVELPGWLHVRPLPDGGVVAARDPAEIALLVGSFAAAPPRPAALFPESGPLRDLLVSADVPAVLAEGDLVVPATDRARDAGLGPEWECGVRFSLERSGDAFVLVRLPADPVVEEAYAPLLLHVRHTLRATPAPAGDLREMGDGAESSE